jgi:hypothetical protein
MICVAVACEDFFALPLDERRWLTGGKFVQSSEDRRKWKKQGAPTKPYFFLLQQAVYDAVKQSEDRDFGGRYLGKGEPVNFVFDRQNEYEVTAHAIINAMRQSSSSVSERIGDVVFSSRHRATVLQVADFIAYECFGYLATLKKRGKHVLSHPAFRLFSYLDSREVFIDAQMLRRLLSHCPLIPHKRFAPPDLIDIRLEKHIPGRGY